MQKNKIVDESLWQLIKERFSNHVESRQAGIDDVDVDEVLPCLPTHQFAREGDIKTEFDQEIERRRQEDRVRREEEERLGATLAREMELEEQRQLQEVRDQETLGLETARKMWRDITSTPVTR